MTTVYYRAQGNVLGYTSGSVFSIDDENEVDVALVAPYLAGGFVVETDAPADGLAPSPPYLAPSIRDLLQENAEPLVLTAPEVALAVVNTTANNAWINVPELVTPPIEMPDRPVTIRTSDLRWTSGVDPGQTEFGIRYTKDGGTTWTLAAGLTSPGAPTIATIYLGYNIPIPVLAPYPGATGAADLAVGDSVQFAVSIRRANIKAIQIVRDPALGVHPFIGAW